MVDEIDKLAELFERFPGIGPRQAQRFVQFLLRNSSSFRRELAESIQEVGTSVSRCPCCMRFHAGERGECGICVDKKRNIALLAVVANDADLLALERSGTYRGRYFVLGGTVSLSSEKQTGLRDKELIKSIPERTKAGLTEIILALPASPEGDVTAEHVREILIPFSQEHGFTITALGRGLSTGSELEYADPDTLRSALDNRR